MSSVILYFRRIMDKIFALLGCCAICSEFPTFRDNVSVPSSRVKQSKTIRYIFVFAENGVGEEDTHKTWPYQNSKLHRDNSDWLFPSETGVACMVRDSNHHERIALPRKLYLVLSSGINSVPLLYYTNVIHCWK
jgi:hypothetical protein